MIFGSEAPTLYRLYYRADEWLWQDFGTEAERKRFLGEIRQSISAYAFDKGEDLVDGIPEHLEVRTA